MRSPTATGDDDVGLPMRSFQRYLPVFASIHDPMPVSLTMYRKSPINSNDGRDGTARLDFQTTSSPERSPEPPCRTARTLDGCPLVRNIRPWPKTGRAASFMPP